MPWGSRSSSSSSSSSDSGTGCDCNCGHAKGETDYSRHPPKVWKEGAGCEGARAGDGKHCGRKGNGCYE